MDDHEQENEALHKVLVNDEEQYSIWPADQPPPPGWREVGPRGRKQECLEYIGEVWTDMRPLSVRRAMDEDAADRNP